MSEEEMKIPTISPMLQRLIMTAVAGVIMTWQGTDIKSTIAENRVREEYVKKDQEKFERRLEKLEAGLGSMQWQVQEILHQNSAIMSAMGIKYQSMPNPYDGGKRQ